MLGEMSPERLNHREDRPDHARSDEYNVDGRYGREKRDPGLLPLRGGHHVPVGGEVEPSDGERCVDEQVDDDSPRDAVFLEQFFDFFLDRR